VYYAGCYWYWLRIYHRLQTKRWQAPGSLFLNSTRCLIAAGIFVWTIEGLQGAMIQMLSHGINVVGMFFIWDIISRRLGTRSISDLGGIAKNAPKLRQPF